MLTFEPITGEVMADTLTGATIFLTRCHDMAKMHGRSNIQWTNVETRVVMKPVVQLERTGCGIASVAALAMRELSGGTACGEPARYFLWRFEVVVRDTPRS